MQKLDKSQDKEYGPVILWADDLIDLLSQIETCKDIEIVADDVKFDSIDELIRECKSNRLLDIKITARNPYLYIELRPCLSRLCVASSDIQASGLFFKLDSILSRCERKPNFIYNYIVVVVSTFLLPGIFLLPSLQSFIFLRRWVWILTFSWLLYIAYIHLRKHSLVYPVRRKDRPSFFKRNSDTIVVAIISALLGAVIGAAATKAFDRIWPNDTNQPPHSETTAPHR